MVPDYEKYLPNIHRFVAVPLKISDHIIGHLQIVNPQPSLFQSTNFLMIVENMDEGGTKALMENLRAVFRTHGGQRGSRQSCLHDNADEPRPDPCQDRPGNLLFDHSRSYDEGQRCPY